MKSSSKGPSVSFYPLQWPALYPVTMPRRKRVNLKAQINPRRRLKGNQIIKENFIRLKVDRLGNIKPLVQDYQELSR